MDKDFCRIIDEDFLIEQYVKGNLPAELQLKVEQHIKECLVHAQALRLEKLLNHGIKEYARHEIKQRLSDDLRRRDETKILVLRFAAVLFVAVLIPVLLYFGFQMKESEPVISEVNEPAKPSIVVKPEKSMNIPAEPVGGVTPEKTVNMPAETAILDGSEPARDVMSEKSVKISDVQLDKTGMPLASPARPGIKKVNSSAGVFNLGQDSIQTGKSIRKKIEAGSAEIKKCLEKNLPDLPFVEIKFTLNAIGKIDTIYFPGESEIQAESRVCLEKIISGLKFAPPGRSIHVYYRFPDDSLIISPVQGGIDTP